MNAQQLRNSILQEALQGRLVPQDANDEPASELIQRIRKEKERLVKEGQLKKKDLETKPIEEEEIPFEIPKSWEWKRWGDLAESIQYGYNAPAKQKGRIKMVRISDIQNGRIVWETVPFCEINEAEIETYLLKKNDILFARTGGTVGKSYLVKDTPEEAIYAGYLIRTRYSDQLCPQYLKLFMESSLYWSQLKEGTIATAQPNCNGKTLSKMVLPIPPLAEQQRIAAKVEELMPLVEKYGQVQTQHDQLQAELPAKLRQSVLQEAIQGRLVPQDPNEESVEELLKRIRKEKDKLIKEKLLKAKDAPVTPMQPEEVSCDIPNGWVFVRLMDVCLLSDGEKKTGSHICMDAKYLRGKKAGDLLTSGKFVKKGDNIILVDGENSGEVFTAPIDGYMGSTFKKLWVSSELYLPYILYIIRSYKEALRNSKRGAAIPHLNKEIFYNIEVGIPPYAEQKRIVTKIEEVFETLKA